jgi:hypothetical protein
VPGKWAHFVQLNAERVAALKGVDGSITERHEPKQGTGCAGLRRS